MSSFLQCSIELLNSYDFVKQKKCKRGLLKSKGSHLCLDCVFHPNLWSNLVPSTWAEPTPPAAKGPTAPGAAQSLLPPFSDSEVLFWPEAAGGRGSQHQLHPGVGSGSSSLGTAAPLPRSQQHCLGWSCSPAQLCQPGHLAFSWQRAQNTSWTSPEASEGLSISPCCSSTSCMTQACDIHHPPSCSRAAPTSSVPPAPVEFHHCSPASGAHQLCPCKQQHNKAQS